MEFCSVIKRNEVMSLQEWMEMEIIMSSEISQAYKGEANMTCFLSHVESSRREGRGLESRRGISKDLERQGQRGNEKEKQWGEYGESTLYVYMVMS
jgi:hypothetical protein